ncbi:MAG TPA: alpha/beta hydrolase [Bradyrhizobium sp.]|nr:alpha/beta hydrolase [Bradyrhizobium sp.]
MEKIKHGIADIEPGVRIHYVVSGQGSRTVVLLHGFPQTWWAWRHVIPKLSDAGFRVIAPDYRGAGHSSHPLSGYDKRSMAADIHQLLHKHLGLEEPVALIGHDIGLMVAYAYAQAFRDEVTHLVVADAPLPGTATFERMRIDPRVWQFSFHNVRDVPEMLIAGRERLYLQAIIGARIFDPSAISESDLDIYASAYAAPGAMRAALEAYRAFDRDVADNQSALEQSGRLTIPVLALGGDVSTLGPVMGEMMREVADNVSVVRVPGTAHFIAEENPVAMAEAVLSFLLDGTL